MEVCKGWWLRMENQGNNKAAQAGNAGSKGAWSKPRCSASKGNSSPPEPALLTAQRPGTCTTGNWKHCSAVSIMYRWMIPRPGYPGGFWQSGPFCEGQELHECFIFILFSFAFILWDWRRKSFLTLHSSCLLYIWVTVTVETAFMWSLPVSVPLLHTQTKMQTPSLVDFTKQPATKQNRKPRAPHTHPEEQLGVWNKNREVMVEACAGVPGAVQSRKQKTWSRALRKSRYSVLLFSWGFQNVHTHPKPESSPFILCLSFSFVV